MQNSHFVYTFKLVIFLVSLCLGIPSAIHCQDKKVTCRPVANDNKTSLISISDEQAMRIGQLIWHNESRGKIEGLTAWNHGEDFASLGIAHFIWYPAGKSGPFVETFPSLIEYLKNNGVEMPPFLSNASGCPWPDRKSFMKSFKSPEMISLRTMLKNTIHHQVRFAALRLERALHEMLAAVPALDHARIRENFFRTAKQPGGIYALMDYVNFKGEGTSETERYQGLGWGLLQVLAEMKHGEPLHEFSKAASYVLSRRVELSPPERNESRWLRGWLNRCQTYSIERWRNF